MKTCLQLRHCSKCFSGVSLAVSWDFSPKTARSTVVQNSQESGRTYWATRLCVPSFARESHHSFAGSNLLALFMRYAAIIRLLTRSRAHSLPSLRKVNNQISQNYLVFSHSAQEEKKLVCHVRERSHFSNVFPFFQPIVATNRRENRNPSCTRKHLDELAKGKTDITCCQVQKEGEGKGLVVPQNIWTS